MQKMNQKMLAVGLLITMFHLTHVYSSGDMTGGLSVVDEKSDNEAPVTTVEESFVDPDVEEFIPTHEWQTVKKGQAIPHGLHIRMNLETGENEAKLMEEEHSGHLNTQGINENPSNSMDPSRLRTMKEAMEQAVKDMQKDGNKQNGFKTPTADEMLYWKDGEKDGMVNIGKDHFTREELKMAMKKVKAERDDVQDKQIKEDSLKSKFRSIDELKEDLGNLNMGIKTDLEILKNIQASYNTDDIPSKLDLMLDLEYYIHQIDNAVNFVELGLMELVLADLNNTNTAIKSEAARIIGSAAQSNPQVQVSVLSVGGMHQLIRMMSTETSDDVRNRVVYATGALLRNFPYAQLKFIKSGGMQALRDLFVEVVNERLKLKIVTLLGDLVHEHNTILLSSGEKTLDERRSQYENIPLLESVSENDWCDIVPTLLALESHDTREKTLIAMTELLPVCRSKFKYSASPYLHTLQSDYLQLAKEEKLLSPDEQSYYYDLYQMIYNIRNAISDIKEEL